MSHNFPQDLGRYIYLANPYQAAPLPAGANWPVPVPSPIAAYPAPGPGLPNPADDWYGLCLNEAEIQEYSGHWDFKGVNRFVRRAVRIPYMYYRQGGNGLSVQAVDHFLIGYEGGGGGN